MNKHFLMTKIKSTGTAYLLWLFLGCHYAYLGKWGLQLLYWFTLGGLGVWVIVDLFHIPTKVDNYNNKIAEQIQLIEENEKLQMHQNASLR